MADFVRSGEQVRSSWANQLVTDIRSLQSNQFLRKVRNVGAGGTNICSLGTLSLSGSNRYINGGIVYCGDKNINIANGDLIITSSTPRTKLVYFEIPLTVNMDDDNKILLPGVDTTTWTPSLEEVDVGTGYPNNTQPTLPTGNGTIIIPLGTLTVTASSWGFVGASCGNVYIDHCAGVLYFTRGEA